jgi:hypothetical protein
MKTKVPTTAELQFQVAKIKCDWNKHTSYVGLYESEYGELTEKKKEELRNVWNLRVMDETIVNRLQSLYEKFIKPLK